MARAKLICNLGPATRDEKTIMKLVKAGMNVARLNFSHDTHDEFRHRIAAIRKISAETGKPIAILGDLCGPKIRIGEIEGGSITVKSGDELTITNRQIVGTQKIVSTTYPDLVSDVEKGNRILIDDGNIELRVKDVKPHEVRTTVVTGGEIKEHKGFNLPGVYVSAPTISARDFSDVEFAVNEGIDMLALSFVRSVDDVVKAKKLIKNYGSDIPIIAKIEKEEAVKGIEDIVQEAFGIMIARGDLGVEIAPERVPIIQKRIISICNKMGKPVITATQMLESMISNPRATRAETSDVANAIIDGSDAVMLSGETSIGRYPVKATETARRIIDDVERELGGGRSFMDWIPEESTVADAVTAAACRAAEILNAKVIVAYTQSGSTAMRLSKYRPKTRILAITPSDKIRRRVELFWGISSILIEEVVDIDMIAFTAEKIVKNANLARKGDIIVITSGTPIGVIGSTNLMNIQRIK